MENYFRVLSWISWFGWVSYFLFLIFVFSDFGFDLIPLLVLLIFRVDQKDSTFGNHLILRVRFSDHPSHSNQRCMLRQ